MTLVPVTLLVVAKAPIPGHAKTRLAAKLGDDVAAQIAAAALLDTLDAVAAAPVSARVVAFRGDLAAAIDGAEIQRQLASFTVIAQRGNSFADRLANAHTDAAVAGYPVLQIGMDTPQVTAELLGDCGRQLTDAPAVLGFARDGGWWALGVQEPESAQCLRTVPMSQPDTGVLTRKALQRNGVDVKPLPELADFDVVDDVAAVRERCHPTSRFARATHGAGL
ncbi:TIGR04282 family arsenosugar biosynthesis glycosyltransferase [Mycobacterium shimoidei]|uniref:TIGR04282 family arsenosugar biosynthesis glycosyltransferase n=1 Tax=Mycobacterium shimoidei TaxID=29313 RepID=UPI0008486FCB|nr:DUF2064 domain-containing protein [Mycobacterium shimoidei]MCV7260488.1 DUF2064 domain-containing protein [Mycobacterium shimoidei]ODR12508.1 glycosyltransferase involved in cell wall biogenesis [Mycobacterium shimoidei]ORW80828.1 glycosyltransferase involved in cell wall biogenesis [Mycobacterium shimoidei]